MRPDEIRAAHDMRVAVQMMTGCAELLRCALRPEDVEAQRYSRLLIQSGAELTRLVNQLMDDAPPRPCRAAPLDISELARRACAMAEPCARSRGVALACRATAPAVAAADPEQAERILMNLLSNALKFTPPGGSVAVGVESAGETVTLSVADTGVGMSDAQLRTLFAGGGGVGLSIVQRYAHANGGEVRAERNPGGGTRFFVTLPAWAERRAEGRADMLASGAR